MKNETKNKTIFNKKNINATANVAETLKKYNKKTNWKNKTSTKFTKTLTGGTLIDKPNLMTQDDIQKLFTLPSKSKLTTRVPTKASIDADEFLNYADKKDFVESVKFLRGANQFDKLLSGLTNSQQNKQKKMLDLFSHSQVDDLTAIFKQNYLVGKIIGEGAYATVRIAVFKPTQLKVALKIYEKIKIKDEQRKKSVRREIKILQLLNHPNIVKVHDVVQTNNHLNISMQYLSGHSLGTYLKAQPNGKIPQKNCKRIFKDLVKALAYMHERNIAHRDIKLENIILDENIIPKLIDFGFSTCIEPKQKIKIFCGTPSYMAPEVVQRREYRGETADIWALGVLLFVSLTGNFPFKGSTDQELYKKIGESDYPKNELMFSKSGADLISKMLTVNSSERITAYEILNHSWFCQNRCDSNKKKQTESFSQERKRMNTINRVQNQNGCKIKIKESKADNIGQKIFSETCKDNLKLELRMALRSPKNIEIQSFRKKNEDKQNMKMSFKNEKTNNNLRKPLIRQTVKQLEVNKKKQKIEKAQPKVIELFRLELKKRNDSRSKSKSNTHRN